MSLVSAMQLMSQSAERAASAPAAPSALQQPADAGARVVPTDSAPAASAAHNSSAQDNTESLMSSSPRPVAGLRLGSEALAAAAATKSSGAGDVAPTPRGSKTPRAEQGSGGSPNTRRRKSARPGGVAPVSPGRPPSHVRAVSLFSSFLVRLMSSSMSHVCHELQEHLLGCCPAGVCAEAVERGHSHAVGCMALSRRLCVCMPLADRHVPMRRMRSR